MPKLVFVRAVDLAPAVGVDDDFGRVRSAGARGRMREVTDTAVMPAQVNVMPDVELRVNAMSVPVAGLGRGADAHEPYGEGRAGQQCP